MIKTIAIPVNAPLSDIKKYGDQKCTATEIAEIEEMSIAHEKEKAYREMNEYKSLRASEYPPIGDQLDVIWKSLQAIKGVLQLPKEAIEMLDKIAIIKEKYKKP